MTFSFLPRTVYQIRSKTSGLIEIKEQLGQLTLHVQGLIQSGGLIKGIWRRALKRVNQPVKSALVLGLGGGTAVHLIKQRWPTAKITAIEIDSAIIQVAKKYFGLEKIKPLKIVQADAFKWKSRKKFDLILVDLYLGDQFPLKAEGEKFLKLVRRRLYPNGVAIFNRLRADKTTDFEVKLKKIFASVERVKTASNDFFLVRRRDAVKL